MIRLIQGDCLEVMDQLIKEGVKVDAIICDPPYGTTQNKWDSVIPLSEMWKRINKIKKENSAVVLFGAEPFSSVLRVSNLKEFKYDWIWIKDNATGFLNAKKQPLRNTEFASVFYSSQCTYNPVMGFGKPYKAKSTSSKNKGNYGNFKDNITENNGKRYPLTTIKFNKPSETQHPTQKPVKLLEYLVNTYTNKGDTVLDFTMGSGTTGVACKSRERDFIGIELDSNYFKIAQERIENEGNQISLF